MQRELQQSGDGDEPYVFARVTARAEHPSPMPRTVVVVAHPDDESLAIGARMTRFREAHFIHITDGAPANGQDAAAHGFPSVDAYREARAVELRNALRTGGIELPRVHALNIPDQHAALCLAEITRSVSQLLAELAPDAIVTHPYEGGHPDHDACAFAVHHAIALNHSASLGGAVIVETPFYHATSTGMEAGSFVPVPGIIAERSDRLTEAEAIRKREILACFTTQRETLKDFPLDQECFRLAPEYDFTRPPHSGPILYDRFPWGVDGRRFLQLATEAETRLSLETPACR